MLIFTNRSKMPDINVLYWLRISVRSSVPSCSGVPKSDVIMVCSRCQTMQDGTPDDVTQHQHLIGEIQLAKSLT